MKASGLDKEASEELLGDFREQAVRMVIAIKMYIGENNINEVGILLHKLKGSSGNIRAGEISRLAMEAEDAMIKLDYDKLDSSLTDIEKLLEGLRITGRTKG
jgi:two-component system, sensor histidine kinase and response regulator